MLVGAADAMTPAHQGESILSYFYFLFFYKILQGSGGYLSEVQSKDAMYNRIWRGGATYQTGLLRLLADSRQCYSVHCVQPRVSSDLAALQFTDSVAEVNLETQLCGRLWAHRNITCVVVGFSNCDVPPPFRGSSCRTRLN